MGRGATAAALGFTHYVHTSRGGRFVLGRKTQRERLRKKLQAFSLRVAALRHHGVQWRQQYVRPHLMGHIQYYGVSGNSRSLRQYLFQASRILFKWLNRRSQRRSITWARYGPWLQGWLPRARIVHALTA